MINKTLYTWPLNSSGFKKETPLNCTLFKKELIRTGTYSHPDKNWTLKVTPERMKGWIDNFNLMKQRSIKVPIPYEHASNSKENTGFITELLCEGDGLYGLCDIPKEEDAKKIGTTIKDVSVGINPNFIDGQGNKYGEVLEHVALTNYPIVPSEENFQRIAAGRDTTVNIIPLSLVHYESEDGDVDVNTQDVDANNNQLNLNTGEEVMINKLIKLLGLKKDATEEEVYTAASKMQVSLEASGSSVRELELSITKLEDAQKADEKPDTDDTILQDKRYLALETETQKLKEQVGTARLNTINLNLNRLQEVGKLSPVMRKELITASKLSTQDNKGGETLLFSIKTYNEGAVDNIEKSIKLLDMLPESSVIPMGEKAKHLSTIPKPTTEMTPERAEEFGKAQRKLMGLKE
jgi:hypothetical protein